MTPAQMLTEANRLVELQRTERGQIDGKDLDGKRCKVLGPYVASPERESRAAQIVYLRREAAGIEAESRQPERRVDRAA